jgi:hypothetical protein
MENKANLFLYQLLNVLLQPFYSTRKNLPVLVPFFLTFTSMLIAFSKLDIIDVWFPVSFTKIIFVVLVALVFGMFAAFPAFKQLKIHSQNANNMYPDYILSIVENKLDSYIENILKGNTYGQLTMSIMVVCGSKPIKRTNLLKIITASTNLRELPSKNFTLKWGEGVAGKIWSQGNNAKEIIVNIEERFKEEIINPSYEGETITPISTTDEENSFKHKAGICLPIFAEDKMKLKDPFLGVFCIGSNQKDDGKIFSTKDFIQAAYLFINKELVREVYILTHGDIKPYKLK